MKTIYEICYDVLFILAHSIITCLKDDKRNEKLLNVLIGKDKTYDAELKAHIPTDLNLDVDFCKNIMILIIISKSYLLNYYNSFKKINAEESEQIVIELENKTLLEILKEFFCCSKLSKKLINDYYAFNEKIYVAQNQAIGLVIANGDLKKLLSLNPLEIFDLENYIPDEFFTTSELAIQAMMDLYDHAIEYCLLDEFGERTNFADEQEFVAKIFLDLLFEKNDSDLESFILYMVANVYEALAVEGYYNYNKDYKYLIDFIESSSNTMIFKRFLSDYTFLNSIINIFFRVNEFLEEDELQIRREEFKKNGNTHILQRLNPYYEEEELALKRIKE